MYRPKKKGNETISGDWEKNIFVRNQGSRESDVSQVQGEEQKRVIFSTENRSRKKGGKTPRLIRRKQGKQITMREVVGRRGHATTYHAAQPYPGYLGGGTGFNSSLNKRKSRKETPKKTKMKIARSNGDKIERW